MIVSVIRFIYAAHWGRLMSYLWLWISVLYAAIQINNQPAVSRPFLIVCLCNCVFAAMCGYFIFIFRQFVLWLLVDFQIESLTLSQGLSIFFRPVKWQTHALTARWLAIEKWSSSRDQTTAFAPVGLGDKFSFPGSVKGSEPPFWPSRL